jgi:hypothetical protein
MKLLTTIADEAPESPRRLNSKIPRGLETVVLECLAKTPSGRPKGYEALREKLRNWSRTGEASSAVLTGAVANGVDLALFLALSSPLLLASFGTASARSAILARPTETAALLVTCGLALITAPVILRGRSLGERLLGVWPGTSAGRALEGWTLVGRALFLSVAVVALPVFQLHERETSLRRLVDFAILFGVLSWILGFRAIRRPTARSMKPSVSQGVVETREWTRILGPYRVAGGLQQSFLNAFDPLLRRPVWILIREVPSETDPLRREIKRPTRLRWLNGGVSDGTVWDAFEAPAGESLSELQAELPWNDVRHLLRDLLRELRTASGERTLPSGLSSGHIWIEPTGRIRVLDALPPGRPPGPVTCDADDERSLASFSDAAARRMLGSNQETLPRNARCFLSDLETGGVSSLTAHLRMAAVLSRGVVDRSPVRLAFNACITLLFISALLREPTRFLAFGMAALAVGVPLSIRGLGMLSKKGHTHGPASNNVASISRSEELLTLGGKRPRNDLHSYETSSRRVRLLRSPSGHSAVQFPHGKRQRSS